VLLDSTNSPGPDHSGRAFFVCPIYEKPRRLRRGEEPHSRSSQLIPRVPEADYRLLQET
jgi:hypothetical protein